MSEKHKCCAKVYSGSQYFGYACGKTAKVERYGNHYCGIHDPVRLAEKQKARNEIRKSEQEAKYKKRAEEKAKSDEQKRRADCFPDLLDALQNLLAVHEGQGGTKYHAGDIARSAIKKATE